MADEITAHLGLVKPEVNGEQTENVWGYDINANFDKIDQRFSELPTSDAPKDGAIYGRRQGAWSRTVMQTDFDALKADYEGHFHTTADIPDYAEATDDRVAAMLRAGPNITIVYDDELGELTIASTGGGEGGGGGAPLVDGDYGDITVSNGGLTWRIDPGSVTYAKIQNVAADKLLGTLVAGSVTEITCTAAGRAFLNDVDAAEQRATLELGSMATEDVANFQPAGDFQAADPTLTSLSFLPDQIGVIEQTGLDVFAIRPVTSGDPLSPLMTQEAADDRYAPLDSPVFIGDARAVTPAIDDNDTSIATSAFVKLHAVAVSDVAPAQTYDGQLWYENDTGGLFLRYNDGNTSQFVQVNAGAVTGIQEAPADSKPYVRYNGTWKDNDPPADGGEYVRVNGVWRLARQHFDLTGANRDISVPVGAKMMLARGVVYQSTTVSTCAAIQVSHDGTNFMNGAADYTYGGMIHYTGTSGYMHIAPANYNMGLLTWNSDVTNIPHQFDIKCQINRYATGTNDVWMIMVNAQNYSTPVAQKYIDTQSRIQINAPAAGLPLDIKKFRFLLGNASQNFGPASTISVEWTY